MSETSERTSAIGLVDRIGGPERLRAILDRFYARLFDDLMVGFFFAGTDRGDIVEGQHAFLMWATGAAPDLRGRRHPRAAHDELAPILRGHFDRRLVVLREILEAEGLEAGDVEAWLRLERSMRRHVQARGSA